MKSLLNLATLFLLLALPLAASAAGTVQIPGTFDNAKFVTSFGERFEATSVRVGEDSLFCRTKGRGRDLALAISDVRYMEIKTGNRAGLYALVGALGGGLSAALGVAQANQEMDSMGLQSTDESDDLGTGLIVGFAAAGGLIGLIVGANTSVYTPVRRGSAWLDTVKHTTFVPTRDGMQFAVRVSF